MLKRLSIIAMICSIHLFVGTCAGAASETKKLSTNNSFFPYSECVEIMVDTVTADKLKSILLLEGVVKRVYCGRFREGERLSVSMNDVRLERTSDLKTNSKQVVAFNLVPEWKGSYDRLRKQAVPVCNLFVARDPQQVNELRSRIIQSKKSRLESKSAFENYLEQRWSANRINDFCRPETQRNWLVPFNSTKSGASFWKGELHKSEHDELKGKKVYWSASLNYGIPVSYSVYVTAPESAGWNVELAEPSLYLEEWTSDDFLKYRISESIRQALFSDWSVNMEKDLKTTERLNLFSNRSEDSLLRDEKSKVVAYRCRLSDGNDLTAILTQKQDVAKIMIDNIEEPAWSEMYRKRAQNLAECAKMISR